MEIETRTGVVSREEKLSTKRQEWPFWGNGNVLILTGLLAMCASTFVKTYQTVHLRSVRFTYISIFKNHIYAWTGFGLLNELVINSVSLDIYKYVNHYFSHMQWNLKVHGI